MKKLNYISAAIAAMILLASCTSMNYQGRDDSFGWNNYPEPEEREITSSSEYTTIEQEPQYNSERSGNYYSSYSANNYYEPEVRYVPVVVPWWSPYYVSYYEPVYYQPGFSISISYGPRYYHHYPYHGWYYSHNQHHYWYCPWYYHNPYYGYAWYDYGHSGYSSSKPSKSTGTPTHFGSRNFGSSRGWSGNSGTGTVPASTTKRTERRDPVATSGSSSGSIGSSSSTLNNKNVKSLFDKANSSQAVNTKNPVGSEVRIERESGVKTSTGKGIKTNDSPFAPNSPNTSPNTPFGNDVQVERGSGKIKTDTEVKKPNPASSVIFNSPSKANSPQGEVKAPASVFQEKPKEESRPSNTNTETPRKGDNIFRGRDIKPVETSKPNNEPVKRDVPSSSGFTPVERSTPSRSTEQPKPSSEPSYTPPARNEQPRSEPKPAAQPPRNTQPAPTRSSEPAKPASSPAPAKSTTERTNQRPR